MMWVLAIYAADALEFFLFCQLAQMAINEVSLSFVQ